MRLFELIVEDEMTDEVFQISLVENPAIEAFGVFFNKEEVHFAEMEEEGLFMAPILIPDKKILRVDGEGTPYEVYFTKSTIKRLSQMYLEKKYQANVNVEHKDKVNGVTLVESWIKESTERDKSKLYGLNVPVGSWIGTFKIDNEEIREKFRSGELKAVSIEGLFEHLEKTTPEELQTTMIMDMWNKHINELSEVEAELMLSVIGDMIELESFTDYGDGIRNNAKRGIELNEKNGNKCATQTGKVRAQQLANGEPISLETIKRMYSFLSRAETYYDESDTNACGTISFLLWGGKAALSYSKNKLEELGEINLAEVGPRGGIRKSPKAPKSDTKNPNPKGEGTAKGDASGKRGAKVTQAQEKTLQGKVDDFNEKDSNTKNGRATLGALKSVFQRGLGAYNTSRSPNVKSSEQWAYARVNAFLFLLKNNRPERAAYVQDNDLLPKEHKKYSEKMEAQPSVNSTYPGQVASGSISPATFSADCPPATQNVEINLVNRAKAIAKADYGPLNPNEPNEGYWKNKAEEFGGNVVEAKKALCGNCAFFDIRKETLDCIAEGIGIDNDPELVIEAGQLGYCKAFEFKCAAKRTCSAWVVGGPIID